MTDTTGSAAPRGYDVPAIAKDLFGTAVVCLLLMVPIVAYKSVITQYSMVLESRWQWVALFLAIILGGRLLMHLFVWNRPAAAVSAREAGRGAQGQLG